MQDASFSFAIGSFQCMAICDGTHTYPDPLGVLFPTAPKGQLLQALLRHHLQPDTWEEFISTYTCLIVDTGTNLVLVDTGAGVSLGNDTGKLLQNLKARGVSPEDIDTVILTHGHPDHIGGNTTGSGEPAFRNARFWMLKEEWEFWSSAQADREMTECGLDPELRKVLLEVAQLNLPPIENQLELLDDEAEIVPGICALAAPGHTPGHMILHVASEGERLFCLSDAIIHPVHLEHPEWHMAVDLNREQVMETRRRFLARAEKEQALVHAFHFPFPGLGHVVQKGKDWHWQPV